jgi:hypothetical protein
MGFSAPLLRYVVTLLKSELVSKETPFGQKKNFKRTMTVIITRSTIEDRTCDKLRTELNESTK